MSATTGAYVEILVDKKWAWYTAYNRWTRMCKIGERGKCTGALSSPEGAIWIQFDDEYYTVAGPKEYRVLSPLELLADCSDG